MALSKQMACKSNDAGVRIEGLSLEGLNFSAVHLQIFSGKDQPSDT